MNRDGPGDIADDRTLVERARRGDSSAMGQLCLRYQDRIYTVCLRLTGSDADAQDVTQAALIRAMDGLPRFEARSSFFTWLYRIAVNLALSQRRSERTMQARIAGSAESMLPGRADDRAASPERDLRQRELRERVQAALDALDEEFRSAVVLKDVEGLDYLTIGEILGVPVGTVKSRIFRGRLMLRELLTPEVGADAVA